MLMQRSPTAAYRRVDFDARVETAGPADLVRLCYDRLVTALGTAIYAYDRSDASQKSESLTQALAAVMALRLGVAGEDGVAGALHRLYEGAARTILDSVANFDAIALSRLRDDFREIASAIDVSAPLAA
jgi:flagellin-specific chaperone FliS